MTVYTVRWMAERLGMDLAELCTRIRDNAQAVYGSWE